MKEPKLYRVLRPIITTYTKIIYRPKYIGLNNIPQNEPFILAGNHTNNLDCILIISSTKKVIHFLGKNSLFKGIKKILFKNMGLIPVNRLIHDKSALNSAIECLKENKNIGIFPEGTINRTDKTILDFKIGAVKMAYETNCAIVPFVIKGEYKKFKRKISIEFLKSFKVNNKDLSIENKKLMNIITNELEKK